MLFDLDGVLLDTAPVLESCYMALAESLNVAPPSRAELREAVRMSPQAALRVLFGTRDVEQRFIQLWRNKLSGVCTFNGIPEVLQELRRVNVTMGTVTSRNGTDTRALLGCVGLTGYMRTIITWGHYRVAKPSPACIIAALRDTDMPPSMAAYIGDQPEDIQAANRAGVIAVGAIWNPYADKKQLKAAGAFAIIEKPIEILHLG